MINAGRRIVTVVKLRVRRPANRGSTAGRCKTGLVLQNVRIMKPAQPPTEWVPDDTSDINRRGLEYREPRLRSTTCFYRVQRRNLIDNRCSATTIYHAAPRHYGQRSFTRNDDIKTSTVAQLIADL